MQHGRVSKSGFCPSWKVINMPRGPNGEKRPADVIGCAVNVARVATGEQEDTTYVAPNRRKSGLAGAKARMESVGGKRRSEIATEAAKARWKGDRTMAMNVSMAKNRLYGDEGIKVSDFKLFPGSSTDVTPDQRADQVNKILAQLEAGDFEEVTEYED